MLLKENFGQPYQITSAFILKLAEGPSLATNNSSELSAFAIDLDTCVITLKGISCVNKINTQHVQRQIINRLPVPIQHKWHAVADNIMHEVKKNISIEDIVYFVQKQAHELSNPVFGVSVKKRLNNQKLFFASAVKPNILLLLLSAFPFSQGWPQHTIILHIFLSSTSVSFTPTSPFGLPLLLFPGNSISIIFLPTYSWSLLMTCPYHLRLPSLIFIPNRSTLTVLLMCSFLILSFM